MPELPPLPPSLEAWRDRIEAAVAPCLLFSDEIARWLLSAGLAFLDGHVRGDVRALAWLESNNLKAASRGVAAWEKQCCSGLRRFQALVPCST
jgi:prepilin-type processing-associated H-X9-DG protein